MSHYVGDSCPGGHRGETVKVEMFENFEAQTGEVHCKGCGAVYPVVYHTSNCPWIGLDKRPWGEVPLRRPLVQEEHVELAAHKDSGKPLVADIDPQHLIDIGTVLARSVGKYPNDPDGTPNWYKGGSHRGFTASAIRHLMAYLSGEDIDPESGLPHLDHASTDIMFVRSWKRRGVGQDDRMQHAQGSHPRPHRVVRPQGVDVSVPPMGD